jgi:hypothetical protein
VIQRICYRAEKRNAKTKKNVDAYKRSEAVAYPGETKKNKGIATFTEYNADVVGMLAKKYVTSGINDQKHYRSRLDIIDFLVWN